MGAEDEEKWEEEMEKSWSRRRDEGTRRKIWAGDKWEQGGNGTKKGDLRKPGDGNKWEQGTGTRLWDGTIPVASPSSIPFPK